MNREKIAYIAGMFDGEGSISIMKVLPRNGRVNIEYKTVVSISNTFEPVIIWIKEKLNSGYISRTVNKKYPQHKPNYRWMASYQQAYVFLKMVLPYLIIKQAQAELAIKLEKSRHNFQQSRKGYKGFTEQPKSLLEEYDVIRESIQILNQRKVTAA